MKNFVSKVLQYTDHDFANSSDKNESKNIDILSISHYESISHWTKNDLLLHGYPWLNNIKEKFWSSMNIDIVIRNKESVVLNNERFWLMKWKKIYIFERDTFEIHWNLIVNREIKSLLIVCKRFQINKRKPERFRKNATSLFSRRKFINEDTWTIMKS